MFLKLKIWGTLHRLETRACFVGYFVKFANFNLFFRVARLVHCWVGIFASHCRPQSSFHLSFYNAFLPVEMAMWAVCRMWININVQVFAKTLELPELAQLELLDINMAWMQSKLHGAYLRTNILDRLDELITMGHLAVLLLTQDRVLGQLVKATCLE